MAPRFTVIQGGLSGESRCDAVFRPRLKTNRAAGLRVDPYRPGSIDTEAVSAWRALLVRNAVSDPLPDPDHLLPLARPRPAGRRVAITLAWDREAEAGVAAPQDVVPLAIPHPVWGGQARRLQPAEAVVTALVKRAAAEAVDRALRARLAASRRSIRPAGAVDSIRLRPPTGSVSAADRPVLSQSIHPESFIGIRPAGWEAPAAESRIVTEPQAARDAVETCRTRDACTAWRPVIADPAKASLVRVVSRLFGRRGAPRVAFLRRAGEIVAGTLHLGIGSPSMPWRRARI